MYIPCQAPWHWSLQPLTCRIVRIKRKPQGLLHSIKEHIPKIFFLLDQKRRQQTKLNLHPTWVRYRNKTGNRQVPRDYFGYVNAGSVSAVNFLKQTAEYTHYFVGFILKINIKWKYRMYIFFAIKLFASQLFHNILIN